MHLLNNEISKCFSAELGHISAPLFAGVFSRWNYFYASPGVVY